MRWILFFQISFYTGSNQVSEVTADKTNPGFLHIKTPAIDDTHVNL